MMMTLSRSQILSFRRHSGNLERKLPFTAGALRKAAWAGLQDSVPRAGLLSLHARVQGVSAALWEDPSLVQTWGPRYTVYLAACDDADVFTKGRLPDGGKGLERANKTAETLRTFLGTKRMSFAQAGHAMHVHPNSLRYASPTGTVRLRWDGARRPVIWMVDASATSVAEARAELARRFLHVFGPSTSRAFARWAGVPEAAAVHTFSRLLDEVQTVRTPLGEGVILKEDEAAFHVFPGDTESGGARLLPSGDPYFLLWGGERELLVSDEQQRDELWTARVWPGALLLNGEIAGVWSRRKHQIAMRAWRRLSRPEEKQLEAEAVSLPLPLEKNAIQVDWLER